MGSHTLLDARRESRLERFVLSLLLLSVLACFAQARTWIVSQSGDGDFERVTDALAAASPNDSILIRPGDYDEDQGPGNLTLVEGKALTIIGTGLRPEDTSVRISIMFQDCGTCYLSTVMFQGATHVALQSVRTDFVIRDCRFEQNTSDFGGAAISTANQLLLEGCIFIGNRAERGPDETNYGGALFLWGPATIRRCKFVDNYASEWGGAICSIGGELLVEDSIFYRNKALRGAAVMAADANIHGSTFALNEVLTGSGACLEPFYNADWFTPISQCIIAQTVNGWGIACGTSKTLDCCDVWGNERGDYGGMWCDNGEWRGDFSADPLFCDSQNGDLGLLEGSPCVRGSHGPVECGLVGARGVGCNADPVERVSWGRLRGLFR